MAAKTIIVRGKKIRSASQRRYIVVQVNYERESGETVSAYVFKRSDSVDTARAHARRGGTFRSPTMTTTYVVVDTTTGEEISR